MAWVNTHDASVFVCGLKTFLEENHTGHLLGDSAINNRYNNAQSSVLWLRGLLDCQRVDLGVYIKLAVVYS
ncbi:hypothetical protein DPMN_158304 [Dreissena polymorpha]|uniref:Uncharacterized protein n=1 Tax=Dreissena polymorpha TaxID=45954 RepID=A0A9D4IQQ7_DREPO|nr:hypothetical protein DPMN_158253 [Dreissena polymorpha]KAH3780488.1 hypothetical protein DPMN_158304 [Dreissena polymorpha]